MKVILDTNVIISSFATHGLCHAVFELCLDRYEVVISPALIKEVQKGLKKKIKLPQPLIMEILDYLSEYAISFETKSLKPGICRDPEDEHVLALAESARVNYIVTGDQDLLILKKYGSAKIVNPRQFWQLSKELT